MGGHIGFAAPAAFSGEQVPGALGPGQLAAAAELPEVQVRLGDPAAPSGPPAGEGSRRAEVGHAAGAGQLTGVGGDPLQDRGHPGQAGHHVRPVGMIAVGTQVDRGGYWLVCRQFSQSAHWRIQSATPPGRTAVAPSTGRPCQRALDDAHAGKFGVLVIWALDRIVRDDESGAEAALRIFRRFRQRGCMVVSVKESWLNGSPEVQDILIAFAGWMAERESARRSERIKAGLARRRAEGKAVGRQAGAKDKGKRKRSGYVKSWEEGGARREAAGHR